MLQVICFAMELCLEWPEDCVLLLALPSFVQFLHLSLKLFTYKLSEGATKY